MENHFYRSRGALLSEGYTNDEDVEVTFATDCNSQESFDNINDLDTEVNEMDISRESIIRDPEE